MAFIPIRKYYQCAGVIMKYKLKFEVKDITGKTTTGYTDEMDEFELSGLLSGIESINNLTHFSMPVADGAKIYYNPKHIVSIIVKGWK